MTPLFVDLLGQRCTGTCDGDMQAQPCGRTCVPPLVHEAFFFVPEWSILVSASAQYHAVAVLGALRMILSLASLWSPPFCPVQLSTGLILHCNSQNSSF